MPPLPGRPDSHYAYEQDSPDAPNLLDRARHGELDALVADVEGTTTYLFDPGGELDPAGLAAAARAASIIQGDTLVDIYMVQGRPQ